MKRALVALAALVVPLAPAQESSDDEKAHLWIYVANGEGGSVDVSAVTANDIKAMELTVTLYAGGKSHAFHFTQPLFAGNPPVTGYAYPSPSITHSQVTAASAHVGPMFGTPRPLKCGNPKREARTVFACNYRDP